MPIKDYREQLKRAQICNRDLFELVDKAAVMRTRYDDIRLMSRKSAMTDAAWSAFIQARHIFLESLADIKSALISLRHHYQSARSTLILLEEMTVPEHVRANYKLSKANEHNINIARKYLNELEFHVNEQKGLYTELFRIYDRVCECEAQLLIAPVEPCGAV